MNALLTKRTVPLALTVMTLSVLACNLPGGTTDPEITIAIDPSAEPTDAEAQPAPTEAPPADPTALCPTPGNGQALYTSPAYGYCFLYPAELTPVTQAPYRVGGIGVSYPPVDPNSMEPVAASVQVAYIGPAVDVSTSEDYGRKWESLYQPPEFQGQGSLIDANGTSAFLIPVMSGMAPGQTAFIVANGGRYQVTRWPADNQFEQIDAQGDSLWALVTGSLVFFPPTITMDARLPGEVCPAARAETFLYIDEKNGFCVLVPDGWYEDAEYGAGWLTTGEVVGTDPEFGELVLRMVFAWAGPVSEIDPATLRQQQIEAGLSPDLLTEITINGFPALESIDNRTPFDQRGAWIFTEQGMYTISANPYDADFGNSVPQVDIFWNLTLETFTIFTRFE